MMLSRDLSLSTFHMFLTFYVISPKELIESPTEVMGDLPVE